MLLKKSFDIQIKNMKMRNPERKRIMSVRRNTEIRTERTVPVVVTG